MRIVYLMYPTSRKLSSCSTFAWSKLFVAELIKRGHFVYWCGPKLYKDSVLAEDSHYVDHPRIKWIDMDSQLGLKRRQYHYLSTIEDKFCELFSQLRGGQYYYDAVISDRILSMRYLKNQLLSPHRPSEIGIRTPFYNTFHYIFSPKNPTGKAFPFYELSQAAGLVDSFNVFGGPWEREMVKISARKYLSPVMVQKAFAKDNIIYGLSCVSGERLAPFVRTVKQRREFKLFTFNFAHAESSVYKFDQFVEQVSKMFQRGRDIRMLITSTAQKPNQLPEHMLTWPNVDRNIGLSQLKFYEKLTTAHAFVVEPREGEISPSNIEQMYLGLLGIFPDVRWVRYIVPKGYPFVYKTALECQTMMRYVHDNYYTDPEIERWVTACQESVSWYADGSSINGFVDHIEKEVTDRIAEQFFHAHITFLGEILQKTKKTSLKYPEWRKFIMDSSDTDLDIADLHVTRTYSSRMPYYWFMKRCGWVDDCLRDMPDWKRGEAK